MLTSSSRRFGTLPVSNVVAFAMAFDGCDKTAHTSTNNEDVDSRGLITINIAVSVHHNRIGRGEVQCLLKASHD